MPPIRPVNSSGQGPGEDDESDKGVGNGNPGRNKRRAKVSGDLGPVERDGQQAHADPATKERPGGR